MENKKANVVIKYDSSNHQMKIWASFYPKYEIKNIEGKGKLSLYLNTPIEELKNQFFSDICTVANEEYQILFEGSEDDYNVLHELYKGSPIETIKQITCMRKIDSAAEFVGIEQDLPCEEEIQESTELTEEVISHILHVEAGEEKIFKRKKLNIQSKISCEGKIIFDQCIIQYDRSNFPSKIILESGATLEMVCCTVQDVENSGSLNQLNGVEKTIDNIKSTENPFITGRQNAQIELQNCLLKNCCNFISTDGPVLFTQCYIKDPGEGFCRTYHDIYIENSDIEFFRTHLSESGYIFDCAGKLSAIECRFLGAQLGSSKLTILSLGNGKNQIQNCSFKYFENCIACYFNSEGVSLCKSSFRNCKNVISGRAFAQDCTFENCEEIFQKLGEGSTICDCQFVSCKNNLFSTEYVGGVTIDQCDFIRLSYDYYDKGHSVVPVAHMLFHKRKDDGRTNYIRGCNFRDIEVNRAFLIAGEILEKVSGYVLQIMDCTFAQCRTKRESQKLIKEYDYYYSASSKEPNELKIISIQNCAGLDLVNQSNTHSPNIGMRTETSKGELIGATTAKPESIILDILDDGKITRAPVGITYEK